MSVFDNIYSVNAAVLVAAGRKTHSQGAFAVRYGYRAATERDILLCLTVAEYCRAVFVQWLSVVFRPKSVGLGFDTHI